MISSPRPIFWRIILPDIATDLRRYRLPLSNNARGAWGLILIPCLFIASNLADQTARAADTRAYDEEIIVVAPTPAGHGGIAADKLPFAVQVAGSDALARSQALDLTDYLAANLGSVNINSAQNNPLQPDVQYRGFTASPLLGLPMGLAVYQNGARINEPLGDAVNWDLLAESAVHSMAMIGGANPLFGLNTLGGALAIEMKNGFNFQGHQVEIYGGSFDRVVTTVESGGNNGRFAYYANFAYFDEEGWRDLSESDAKNVYGALTYQSARSTANLGFQYGDSELRGNGASPVGLLARDRAAIFTAPDITENDMIMFTFDGHHTVTNTLELAATAFYRDNETASFNGDAGEFQECDLGGGAFLIEELDDDGLDDLGLNEDDVCEQNALAVADPEALENALDGLAGSDVFAVEDLTDELSGTLILEDSAINNHSTREQESYGGDIQFTFRGDLFSRSNYFVLGFGYFRGEAAFDSVLELADIDPISRSTAGLGVGTFVDEEAVSVATETATWSVYFMNTIDLTDALTLTIGGRFNDTDVQLRDRGGARPELNGDHNFDRFNPSVGLSYDATENMNVFGNYSESSRAPTPIELACNEGVFEIARTNAIANGDDPDDVELECRLPNAFLADPPLEQVVAKSYEIGVRGSLDEIRYRVGYFHTANKDDIIFQTTGRATGLFANVDETLRQGVETAFSGTFDAFDWFLAYSYIDATFEADFLALSPNHAFADEAGEIRVSEGDRIPGIPPHQLKFGGDYHLPHGISLGFDLIYNSTQFLRGDESNQLDEVDAYALVNLRASYAVSEHLQFFARVVNVFDTGYENFGLLGEDPSEVLTGLADTRPRFLGAGAERGAWIGVRLRL